MRAPRRHFLFGSLAGLAGGLTARPAAAANETVTLGFVGVRGRGHDLIKYFGKRSDVAIAYLADVDSRLLPQRAAEVASLKGRRPETVHGLPARARRQERRRGRDRHPRPLARAGDHLGLPGGQGRLRREADQPQHLGGPQDGRGGAQARAGRPGRYPVPQRHRTWPRPSSTSTRASSARSTSSRSSTASPGRASASCPTSRSLPASTTTCGWARPRRASSTRTTSITPGTGSGTTRAAT